MWPPGSPEVVQDPAAGTGPSPGRARGAPSGSGSRTWRASAGSQLENIPEVRGHEFTLVFKYPTEIENEYLEPNAPLTEFGLHNGSRVLVVVDVRVSADAVLEADVQIIPEEAVQHHMPHHPDPVLNLQENQENPQVRAGQSGSEPVRAGQSGSEPVRAGQSGSERVRAGQSRSERVRAGQSRSERVRAGQSRSEPVRAGQSRSERVRAGQSGSTCWREEVEEILQLHLLEGRGGAVAQVWDSRSGTPGLGLQVWDQAPGLGLEEPSDTRRENRTSPKVLRTLA
ncbi:hypothetical protein EYF80_063440 [Liparis tanakae]|uniref:Uncharacterized protein n=1 Tax=Liparis tanakae TaxID=230148 RepID=A0A4Z2ED39_9TELE|nr:hypothetical protein EYF80_063440 [Liparis tanakae]